MAVKMKFMGMLWAAVSGLIFYILLELIFQLGRLKWEGIVFVILASPILYLVLLWIFKEAKDDTS